MSAQGLGGVDRQAHVLVGIGALTNTGSNNHDQNDANHNGGDCRWEVVDERACGYATSAIRSQASYSTNQARRDERQYQELEHAQE